MLFKKIIILLIIAFISGCSGCWTPIAVVSCGYNPRSDVDQLSDKGTYDQKLQDFKNCGANPDMHGNFIKNLIKKAKQDGLDDEYLYVQDTFRCMVNKGYSSY